MQFNARVLGEAGDPTNPLFERAKFLSITCTNLDEFFMIRFASLIQELRRARESNLPERVKALLDIRKQIIEKAARFATKQKAVFTEIEKSLAEFDLKIAPVGAPDGREIFTKSVAPYLTMTQSRSRETFRSIENLQFFALPSLGGIVTVAKTVPLAFYEKNQIFFLDRLLESFLPEILPKSESKPLILRLRRDADVSVEIGDADSESIPDVIRRGIRGRERRRAVSAQHRVSQAEARLADIRFARLSSAFGLEPDQIMYSPIPLATSGLWNALKMFEESGVLSGTAEKKRAFRYDPEEVATTQPELLKKLEKRDILLHHPFDSFEIVTQWVKLSSKDPNVKSIQFTLYRTDLTSPLIAALKAAAENKKSVTVFIELRARFDELNNVALAEDLRKSGVEVRFGFGKLKLHAKIALITSVINGETHYSTHLSTGNYHPGTARQYTDLAILTKNPEMGKDAQTFFEAVRKNQIPVALKLLAHAPTRLHTRLKTLIKRETQFARDGKPAAIFVKVNALIDADIISSLYEASSAGVKIDLIVRGACSLVPGLKGMSDNIRVFSIVDRYLEHSRIYYFKSSERLYLSSADWMPRNFYSRLELAFPVIDERIFKFITDVMIPTYLNDGVKARELGPNGKWKLRELPNSSQPVIRSQEFFRQLSRKGYEGTPLSSKKPKTT